MKVRIISSDFILPMGTVLDVGTTPPRSWAGQYEVVDPLDHDGDGKKGGVWSVEPIEPDTPVPVIEPITGGPIPPDTPAPIEQPPRTRR